MGNWITLDTHHGKARAWEALPEGTPRGGLVVIQEIFGVNEHMRSVAERFAAEGYAVLAPSFFDLLDDADAGKPLDRMGSPFQSGPACGDVLKLFLQHIR